MSWSIILPSDGLPNMLSIFRQTIGCQTLLGYWYSHQVTDLVSPWNYLTWSHYWCLHEQHCYCIFQDQNCHGTEARKISAHNLRHGGYIPLPVWSLQQMWTFPWVHWNQWKAIEWLLSKVESRPKQNSCPPPPGLIHVYIRFCRILQNHYMKLCASLVASNNIHCTYLISFWNICFPSSCHERYSCDWSVSSMS